MLASSGVYQELQLQVTQQQVVYEKETCCHFDVFTICDWNVIVSLFKKMCNEMSQE